MSHQQDTPAPPAPTQSSNRIAAIDALRGFALFGILIVNASFFAMPVGQSMAPTTNIEPAGDLLTAFLIKALVEMKFVSIFSLLFGVGLAIQRDRAITRGRPFLGFAYRRLGVLALFGILHALLLWYGDILFLYACIGSLMVLLLPCSARTLFTIGACLLLASTLMISAFTFAMSIFDQPGMTSGAEQVDADSAPRGIDAIFAAELNPDHPTWQQAEATAFGEGPFIDALAFRGITWGFYLLYSIFTLSGYIASMFLFGAALWKSGFFKGSGPGVAWRRPILIAGLGVGLPLAFISTSIQHLCDAPGWMALSAMTQFMGAACIALGISSLFMILGDAGRLPGAGSLAAVGRMSLTVYLLETIVFITITNHWGFGAFGSFDRVELLVISIMIYAVILLMSIAWQRAGWRGPAEWLWRTLAYTGRVEWKTRPIRGRGDASL